MARLLVLVATVDYVASLEGTGAFWKFMVTVLVNVLLLLLACLLIVTIGTLLSRWDNCRVPCYGYRVT